MNSTTRAIQSLFDERPDARLKISQIKQELGDDYKDIVGAVESLVSDGLLCHAGHNKYALPASFGMIKGVLRVRSSGKGFVYTDTDKLFITPANMSNAIDGDVVLVRKLSSLSRNGAYNGRIAVILHRTRKGVSGISRKAGRGWVLDPVNPVLPRRIPLRIPSETKYELTSGRIVFAQLSEVGKGIEATLSTELGDPDSPTALLDSVVADTGVPVEFPEDVLDEASQVACAEYSLEGREDYRDLPTITIDPVTARDFDDAISIVLQDEGYKLFVHIADVGWYVRPGSLLDAEARLRSTSIYLPDRVIPMLPEVLSNGSCSLRLDEDRLTRTVVLNYDSEGNRGKFDIVPSVINSNRRMTYSEALECLDDEVAGTDEISVVFRHFKKLAKLLEQRKLERGALDLGSDELRTVFGSDGYPCGFEEVPSDDAHRMIEYFMIEANAAVADYCGWSSLPILYRVHGEPGKEAGEKLREQLRDFEIELPGRRIPAAGELNKLLADYKDSPLISLLREFILRSLRKAIYEPQNRGHYGLALNSYLHFTSPIRRYPDLIVHQVLTAIDSGEMPGGGDGLNVLGRDCSLKERNADTMERDGDELMGLMYLSRQLGREISGVVTGIQSFGAFVQVCGVPAEGFVPRSELRNFNYARKRNVLSVGDSVTVSIVSVDILERKLTLDLVAERGK